MVPSLYTRVLALEHEPRLREVTLDGRWINSRSEA
jgi:hypothetical protein